jgi:outer membrane protein TolC
MKRWENHAHYRVGVSLLAVVLFLFPPGSRAAEMSLSISQKPTEQKAGDGVLRLEDAISIALQRQPRIKGAQERIGAQEAVVGQVMAAYYPTVKFTQSYGAGPSGDAVRPEQKATSQANVDMTLYNFGKREGLAQEARDTLSATRYDHRATADEVVLAVKQAYYVYLQAQALVRVREEAVKSRELIVHQARGFFEVGTRPKIDVARAESNLYSARTDLIAAENAVKIALVTLKNAMGIEQLPGLPMAEPMSIVRPPVTLDQARESAFVARPELMSFDAKKKAQDEKIATARRGHLPDLGFKADYGRSNSSTANAFPLKPAWEVKLTLTIPIFEGFKTTNTIQKALRDYHVIRAQEEEQKQQVALEVESSYLRLVEAEDRIKATEAALNAAKENLDLANGRYQVGVGTIIEVTDAQTLYTDAQTRNIQSMYDFKIFEAQLIRAMGQQ